MSRKKLNMDDIDETTEELLPNLKVEEVSVETLDLILTTDTTVISVKALPVTLNTDLLQMGLVSMFSEAKSGIHLYTLADGLSLTVSVDEKS